MSKVNPIPDGYHSVTPYLIVENGAMAIEFYKTAFDAKELVRVAGPGGRVGHAELEIGNSRIMLADEHPEIGALSPKSVGGSPVSLLLYVGDVDAVVEQAVKSGAGLIRPVQDQFYGDRTGGIEDPFGHKWYVATHIEDVAPDEAMRRAAEIVEAAQNS